MTVMTTAIEITVEKGQPQPQLLGKGSTATAIMGIKGQPRILPPPPPKQQESNGTEGFQRDPQLGSNHARSLDPFRRRLKIYINIYV